MTQKKLVTFVCVICGQSITGMYGRKRTMCDGEACRLKDARVRSARQELGRKEERRHRYPLKYLPAETVPKAVYVQTEAKDDKSWGGKVYHPTCSCHCTWWDVCSDPDACKGVVK